jgi:hypothetical protein
MKLKKNIKKLKVKISKNKPFKKDKKPKIRPSKKDKKPVSVSINQLESLDVWLNIWNTTKKLPHNRIVCSDCKVEFIGLKGVGMAHAKKKFDGDMKRVLTESVCKNCKPKPDVEKKERVVEVLTREEMQARRDKISETLPKIDFHKERTIYDISKNKDKCKEYTYFSCHRPDIYLDYGCEQCSLNKHCVCPLKDISRIADGRHKVKKKK